MQGVPHAYVRMHMASNTAPGSVMERSSPDACRSEENEEKGEGCSEGQSGTELSWITGREELTVTTLLVVFEKRPGGYNLGERRGQCLMLRGTKHQIKAHTKINKGAWTQLCPFTMDQPRPSEH
ncbi:hypothetical protein Y1Q_0001070 [Alligator mississippiensis]|uniref:Uncharacterized protein n=1 Tax=Alligator mississippiensis TaxID=8496 RepID=A0A151NEE4_ALLMI|nr:hypothetical protein Y1Q_0001070 [Alligator mississippiensis]